MKTLFKSIFESAPDAVIVINWEGQIILCNNQAKKLFGFENDDLIGMEVETLLPKSLVNKHKAHRINYRTIPQVREMGKDLELVGKRKDGSEFSAEISLSPVTIDDQLFVSAAIRDVTEKKEMLKQLRDQQNFCNAQNSRLLNFAFIVSHNLRSHAGNLGIMLDFFENATSLKEKKEIMIHLKAISYGLSDTIKHLNEVASMQTDININKEIINLRDYIAKTEEILKGEINAKRGTVVNNVPPDTNLLYNPAYMESILLNFISNSIKYSHPERNPVVTINAFKDNGRSVLEIKDNGLGIELKKYKKQLFGLHKTFHGNKDARGIGLFITKNQIEALGGKVDVQSDVGKGTTFKIFLT